MQKDKEYTTVVGMPRGSVYSGFKLDALITTQAGPHWVIGANGGVKVHGMRIPL